MRQVPASRAWFRVGAWCTACLLVRIAAPSARADEVAGPGQLLPGDHLRFQIVEDGDAPVELVVNQQGMVELPYLGSVPTAGLTVEGFATAVKHDLDRSYYRSATVRISLEDRPERTRNRGRVFVSGQVHRVGAIEIDKTEKNTAGKVILANGGLTQFADARKIKLFRTNAAGVVETKVVDLHEVLEKGRIDLDVPICDGDLIVVGAKLVNW